MATYSVWSDFDLIRHSIKNNTVDRLKQILSGFNEECSAHLVKTGKKQEVIDRIVATLDGWRVQNLEDRWLKGKAIIAQVKNSGIYNPNRMNANPTVLPPPVMNASANNPMKNVSWASSNPASSSINRYDPYAPPRKPTNATASTSSSSVKPAESTSATDRKQQTVNFSLTNEQVSKLKMSKYSPNAPFTILTNTVPCPVEFPPTCEVRVNNVQLTANLKGLKKKPGTAPPPDIGKYCRLTSISNKIEMVYVNSQQPVHAKKYYLVVMLVEAISVECLVTNLKSEKYQTSQDIQQRMVASMSEDDDIIAGPQKMSLKCPLSYMRVNTPCRSAHCVHPQCFDATSWFSVMEQTTTWMCPVCERVLSTKDLIVDGYFDDILKQTPEEVEDVIVEADGEWHTSDNKHGSASWKATHPVEGESVSKPPPQPSSRSPSKADIDENASGKREVYILDSDDEDDESQVKQELSPSIGSSSQVLDGTTTSSKHAASNGIIDLTLDSDDEESPPPMQTGKRKAPDLSPSSTSPSELIWKKSRTDAHPFRDGGGDYGQPSASQSVPPIHPRYPPYSESHQNNYNGTYLPSIDNLYPGTRNLHVQSLCMFRTLITKLYSTRNNFAPLTLRPYQEHCVDACLDALAGGASRIGVSLPTGSGKTTVFISLLARIAPPTSSPAANRSMIIVNSVELARQSADQVSSLFPNWSVEIEQGVKHHASGKADVTIATYQTLLSSKRLEKFDPTELKAIVVDEAHHAAAPSIQNPDPSFTPPTLPHKIPVIGFSATFSRHDGLALGSVFERIVYHRDFLEMIKEQCMGIRLCDVRFTSVRANLNLKSVTINARSGEFNPSSLAQVVNSDSINELVVKTWIDRAALTQSFRDHGIDARYVYAKTPPTERQALVAAFRAGQFPVLINCCTRSSKLFLISEHDVSALAILTEGTDIPNIDCVVIARPTRSRNVFAQMIGRGMRLSPGTSKLDCRIIDFVDTTSRVSGVVSIPTLFGLSPDEIEITGENLLDRSRSASTVIYKKDESTESLERRVVDAIASVDANNVPMPTSVTYTEYEDPFSLVSDASGAPHISKLSNFAWVACGSDIYVLDLMGRGHIRVEPNNESAEEIIFRAHYTPAMFDRETAESLNMSPYLRSRHILSAETLSDAIRGCDTYVTHKLARGAMMIAGLLRSARWRKTNATDGQKKMISNRWSKRGVMDDLDEVSRADKINRMTKGQAANVITRLKHGAQKRYQQKVKVIMKQSNFEAKEKLRRNREVVQVGPLST
ncbi:hypothetical protein H0H93_015181 [Arthromyces matolae]|nr:hypothetical protein H0H93_015181 [Arthromyces matolae]